MSSVRCLSCGNVWDAEDQPLCPTCVGQRWSDAPDFISPRHDPRLLPSSTRGYRSVVTHDLIANKDQVIEHMTISGAWYFDDNYGSVCCHTPGPFSVIPGSGIEAGDPMPDHALDDLFVADAVHNPHLMPYDEGQFQDEIHGGRFLSLAICVEDGCSNYCVPEHENCVLHVTPPLAEPAR